MNVMCILKICQVYFQGGILEKKNITDYCVIIFLRKIAFFFILFFFERRGENSQTVSRIYVIKKRTMYFLQRWNSQGVQEHVQNLSVTSLDCEVPELTLNCLNQEAQNHHSLIPRSASLVEQTCFMGYCFNKVKMCCICLCCSSLL